MVTAIRQHLFCGVQIGPCKRRAQCFSKCDVHCAQELVLQLVWQVYTTKLAGPGGMYALPISSHPGGPTPDGKAALDMTEL